MATTDTKRRTLTKGALWAAPIIVASAAVPVYAASPTSCDEYVLNGSFLVNAVSRSDGVTGEKLTYVDPASGVFGFSALPVNGSVTTMTVTLPLNLKFADSGDGQWTYSSDMTTATYIGPAITETYNDETGEGYFLELLIEPDFEKIDPINPGLYPVTISFNASCTGGVMLEKSNENQIRQ